MIDDRQAWLVRCGIPVYFHDADIEDVVPGFNRWLASGAFAPVEAGDTGVVLCGDRSLDALAMFARWYVNCEHTAQVMSLTELAKFLDEEDRDGLVDWSRNLDLLCVADFQGDQESSPLTATQTSFIAYFLWSRWRNGQAIILQVETVVITWWPTWFKNLLMGTFVRCNTNAFVEFAKHRGTLNRG